MNADLERQLNEMGPEYRALVGRLRAAATATASIRAQRRLRWVPLAAAASVAAALALAAVFCDGGEGAETRVYAVLATNAAREYRLAYDRSREALGEILRTQNPDGSWASDYLTRQNAAAIRDRRGAEGAYRRALRYLRSRNLSPLW